MGISADSIREAHDDVARYGSIRAAARETGKTFGHYQRRMQKKPPERIESPYSLDCANKIARALFVSVREEPEPAPADNSRILIISDLHAPYHHKDALAFLAALQEKHQFTRIVNIGDELDMHALSYHDHDPDLDSAGRELQIGRQVLWELEKMFPRMDLLESNHGSLLYRKGRTHGIPRAMLVEYRDVVFGEKMQGGTIHRPGSRGENWIWHPRLTLELPNRGKCLFVHQASSSSMRNVEQQGFSHTQGHYHTALNIMWHGTSDALSFGLTVGCLIDDAAYAYRYNKLTIKRPVIGCAAIIDGMPVTLPMVLAKGGRWTGFVP